MSKDKGGIEVLPILDISYTLNAIVFLGELSQLIAS